MSNTISDSELVPASTEAQRLGVSREAMVRRIQKGAAQGMKIGGNWFVIRGPRNAPPAATD